MTRSLKSKISLGLISLALGASSAMAGEPAQGGTPDQGGKPVPVPVVPPGNGCFGTCLPLELLPMGTVVSAGVAYHDWSFLACDADRPINQQLQWVLRVDWYYYVPAQLCAVPPPLAVVP